MEAKKIGTNVKNTLTDFKKFISKGNIIDLSLGVVIGTAFGKITTSLVNDVIMPIIGIIIGGINFQDLVFKYGEAVIGYGKFIQSIIDFLIIAACVFTFTKIFSKFKAKEEAKPAAPDPNIVLLESIRDELIKLNEKK
ncbi:large conductance mechanosensitive channel protein MscL [Treponema parvum]|uniref:large conductance mechanosensitive channel protein MscL n=1 Tax=Treponema parvum TaxID=138851 RepID=UPI001AEBFAA4|nr:large conductance mechanosensitive channel protein MscL [Treponema parvum]QTQ15400.1 large conductance mechanosensitive channel protein MscL [Treponema parvum]